VVYDSCFIFLLKFVLLIYEFYKMEKVNATDSCALSNNNSKDFFTNIFDASDWPARWHCGNWSDFHGWLHIFKFGYLGCLLLIF